MASKKYIKLDKSSSNEGQIAKCELSLLLKPRNRLVSRCDKACDIGNTANNYTLLPIFIVVILLLVPTQIYRQTNLTLQWNFENIKTSALACMDLLDRSDTTDSCVK